MTGFHNAVGRKISEFIPNYADENLETLLVFDEVASSGIPRKWEHHLKAIDKWFSFSLFSPRKGEIIVIAADNTETKKYEQHIFEAKEHFDYMAHHDPLTKLPNRTSLIETLQLKTLGMEDHPFALLFLDLDGFKEINDSYGHRFGDELLIRITTLLQKLFMPDTFISRTGGDEFVILLSCQKDKNIIHTRISSLVDLLNNPLNIEEIDVYITASIGIAMYPSDASSAEELFQKADAAMYNAKDLGKNTYSFYDVQFTQKTLYHTTLSTRLKKAMQNSELELYFQPQINVETEKLVGLEALLRWPTLEGMISPAVFIPIAEESGLILQLGEYVLREGCQIATQWAKDGLLNARVALNVSARQLTHIDFLMTLDRIVKETKCAPSLIELEITESSIIRDPIKIIPLLDVIKAKGFHISIDDFGTGYSSLSYLKNLPCDKLKIDISFIRNITHEPKNQTIVKAIIALAKGLGMSALAEGVESSEELEFLRQNGIDSIQGYYYYKPMPLFEMTSLLLEQSVKK
jgi:diguanylate cyclase (GGDEF)-like protein